jgi:hypothetical protein
MLVEGPRDALNRQSGRSTIIIPARYARASSRSTNDPFDPTVESA